jgi:hypothetical protein
MIDMKLKTATTKKTLFRLLFKKQEEEYNLYINEREINTLHLCYLINFCLISKKFTK